MDKRLEYTIRNSLRIAQKKYTDLPMWGYLTELMGVGSGTAYKLCRELGHDPDKKAKDFFREDAE